MSENEKLDERGLQFARDAVKSAAAYNPMGDISTVADVAIRAYLQTAAADVSGLVDDSDVMKELVGRYGGYGVTVVRKGERLVGWNSAKAVSIAISDLRDIFAPTLSARNAALEAENERLRGEREACIAEAANYCRMRYKGRYPLNLHSPAVFTSHEHQCIEEHIRAALSAPKGGPHG